MIARVDTGHRTSAACREVASIAPATSGARNVRWGLIFLSVGLLAGLGMSLFAFEPIVPPPAGLERYDDLPRRLLRLAHIAAVMLPLMNVVLGGWLVRVRLSARVREWASWLLLLGGLGTPVALGVEAAWAPARALHFSGPPVLAFCAGVALVSLGAMRTRFETAQRP